MATKSESIIMTRSKDKLPAIDENLLEAIRTVVREETKVFSEKLDTAIAKIESLSQKYADIEKGLEDCSAKLEKTIKVSIPRLRDKVSEIATALTMQRLQADCHHRKWSLIIQGLKGEANETSDQTTQKCIDMATNFLKVNDASRRDFAACHRLKKTENAGIIVRFLDLGMRDRWLAGARGLAKCPDKISLSPDLPPATRCLRNELIRKRASLPPSEKRSSSIKYLKAWPFVQLTIKGKSSVQPSISKTEIAESLLGTNLLADLDLN